MTDPILDVYARRRALEELARETERTDRLRAIDQQREMLLGILPRAIDRAFVRLAATGYNDEVIVGSIRSVRRKEEARSAETVAWVVGYSDPYWWTREDQASDSFFLTSRRTLARSDGPNPSASSGLLHVDAQDLSLPELQSVLAGLEKVGLTQAESTGRPGKA